ncbi:MAG TPA: amidohydrolase [Vicinamibacterales bacterium]|nr:amidohydrolase [Vicinamibacterales bacterium]
MDGTCFAKLSLRRSLDSAPLPALLVVALISVGCSAVAAQPGATPASLVIVNGRVYPADGSGRVHEAIAMRGNRIAAVGSRAEIEALRGPATEVLDASGGAVIPGLIDSHVHLLMGAETLDQVNLRGVTDAAEAQRRIREWRAAHADRSWIRGQGFYTAFTRQQLDAATGDTPAHFLSGDAHSCLVNSAALRLAGITRNTADPPGGRIARDPTTGEPTGHLLETAQTLMYSALPPLTQADMRQLLALATAEAHRAGVTTAVVVGGSEEIDAYDAARAAGALALRIRMALWLREQPSGPGLPSRFDFSEREADHFDEIRRRHKDDALLRTSLVKIMLDGVIESHTAAMLAPYSDRSDTSGATNYTADALTTAIGMMDRRGWQVMTHALGDKAVRMALDAYEKVAGANPVPSQGRRHRIEHIEAIDPADVSRFGKLGVIASLQPAHAGGMNNPARSSQRWTNIGYERSAWGFPWRSIRESGGRVVFGSDWPVASLNPGRAMAVAVNRLEHPPVPGQRLTMPEVLAAYTADAAYGIFDDSQLGSLKPGLLADVVVLSRDILTAPPETNDDFVVGATVFDGRVVYRRADAVH